MVNTGHARVVPAQTAMPHDWRLPIPMLEDRDAWFTRTKTEIEMQVTKAGGAKAVLVSHSYGAIVTFAFLTWVEEQQAGWVDKHLESWANLAGPILGLPKAIAPLLSGEGAVGQVASLLHVLACSMLCRVHTSGVCGVHPVPAVA
jgi:phospholipid:diacylglycerol acyltransferase